MTPPKLYIAVIGRGDCDELEALLAQQVGAEIARAGAILVCGGLGGIMAAACRGAKEANGTTIGILPGGEKAAANAHVDYAIATSLGEARNLAIVRTADGIVALPGAFGTLSEIAFALKYNKPIVTLGSWNVSTEMIVASTPAEAVQRILEEVSS